MERAALLRLIQVLCYYQTKLILFQKIEVAKRTYLWLLALIISKWSLYYQQK